MITQLLFKLNGKLLSGIYQVRVLISQILFFLKPENGTEHAKYY